MTDEAQQQQPGGPVFWASAAIGLVVVAWAGRELLGRVADRASVATFVLGSGVVHDALLAPLVAGAGWATAQLVPAWARVPVRVALAFSYLLVVFTWPLVRGYGTSDRNPSIDPLDYGPNLVGALVAVWAVAAGVVASTAWRRRGTAP